ncbi:hypothetical protein PRZ48_006260 [Zasmidium cellare]|uniref:Uncharacterized protein n=1 Tax=Zasmidium cellare TaxID=395010 RepID=A0ABR0EMK3_ZASCE|nr:hypothetical protein PRZ48_006260 [Zasmidium cellare]
MCNVRTLTYVCGHVIPFRLSTCRGNFTYTTRKSPTGSLSSCRSFPLLNFISQQPCGACLKASAEKDLEEKIAELRLSTEEDDWTKEPAEEVVQAEAELASEIWRLEEFYPDRARFKKEVRPERGPLATRNGSLLSREVRAEDVVVKYEAKTAMVGEDWDWGEGYRDLGEEIAEDMGMDLPGFVECGFGEGEGEEGQPAEEFCQVMDWGVATDWGLPGEGEREDGSGGEVESQSEESASGNEDAAVLETGAGLDEDQGSTCEAAPSATIASILEEDRPPICVSVQHSSRQEHITVRLPPRAMDESKPKHKENEATSSAKARPPRSRGRSVTAENPPQQKAMNACEPFRACSPFWMEFAVSV